MIASWTKDGKEWTSSDCDTIEIGQCYFIISEARDGYSICFKPSLDGKPKTGSVHLRWPAVHEAFGLWAKRVAVEVQYDDPWSKISQLLPGCDTGTFKDNDPFTHSEAEMASKAVLKFIDYIKDRDDVDAEQVDAEFTPTAKRLSEFAKTGAGKIDWSNQFIGMLVSIIIVFAFNPDQAAEIWAYWKTLIVTGITE